MKNRFRPNLLPALRDQYQLVVRLLVGDKWHAILAYVEALEKRVAELERMKYDKVQ